MAGNRPLTMRSCAHRLRARVPRGLASARCHPRALAVRRVALTDGTSLPLEEVVLQRGRVYSVWVVPGASGPEARLEEANVATMP